MTFTKKKKSQKKELKVKTKKKSIIPSEYYNKFVSIKKIKKNKLDKQPLPKQPNKLSIGELRRRTNKTNDHLHKSIIHIFNEDGLRPQDAPFVSYLLNLVFKYDVLFDESSSPHFKDRMKLNKELMTKNSTCDDFEYYEDVLMEVINRQDFLSATRDYISGRAGGKYKSKLKTINQSWRT